MTHDEIRQFIEKHRLAIVVQALTEFAAQSDDDFWTSFAHEGKEIDLNVYRPEGGNFINLWGYRIREDGTKTCTDTSKSHLIVRVLFAEYGVQP